MDARSEYFTTPGVDAVRLHSLCWGDPANTNLVLLHGGGANAHWWSHLGSRWSDGFCVRALDFRGHGQSDHPDAVTRDAFSRDLEALIAHSGAPDAILVGHSMGGRVALSHASRHAEVRGLILVDVARGGGSRVGRAARLALSRRRSYRTRDEAVDRFRFVPPTHSANETLRRTIAAHSVCQQPDGRFAYNFDPRWFGLKASRAVDCAAVACPALLLRGSQSELLSASGADALVSEIPGARWVEIEGAGHHVHLDRPEAFAREVDRFLEISA